MADDMKINPQRAQELIANLSNVTKRVQAANKTGKPIRLVAVSKLKPANDILALHRPSSDSSQTTSTDPTQHPSTSFQPHLHFGENYVQELSEKAQILPRSIRWHFIGGLQSNKCKPLAESVRNLWCVESVDSTKKADQLEKGRAALKQRIQEEEKGKDNQHNGENGPAGVKMNDVGDAAEEWWEDQLRVMVQVNTSGEESKSGVEPGEATSLCRHIRDDCPNLRLQGLMTIGAIARSKESTPDTLNEDFESLTKVRDDVAQELAVNKEDLELSMGMSADFEAAIKAGSDEVRVGSTIFGERPPKKDAKVKDDVASGDEG